MMYLLFNWEISSKIKASFTLVNFPDFYLWSKKNLETCVCQ